MFTWSLYLIAQLFHNWVLSTAPAPSTQLSLTSRASFMHRSVGINVFHNFIYLTCQYFREHNGAVERLRICLAYALKLYLHMYLLQNSFMRKTIQVNKLIISLNVKSQGRSGCALCWQYGKLGCFSINSKFPSPSKAFNRFCSRLTTSHGYLP